MERLRELWELLKPFDTLFGDFVNGDFEHFVRMFVMQDSNGVPVPTGLFWDIDDVGMFSLTEIKPLDSGLAHFLFWDQKFKGREELCRGMIRYAFETYKFHRVRTEVGLFAPHTLNAVKRIGFVQEGRKRQAVMYKGDWFDVNTYSILKEDLDKPRAKLPWGVYYNTCYTCGEVYNKQHKTKVFLDEREVSDVVRNAN